MGVLAGGRRSLYGMPLDGWLYCDPSGARWLVTSDLEQSWPVNGPISGTVRLTRFGVFGAPAESHDYAVSLADIGQPAGEALEWTNVEGVELITSLDARVTAISPTGHRAAVMLHKYRYTGKAGAASYDPFARYPAGWLELAIDGNGASATVSLSVLRSRAQTISASADPEIQSSNFDYGWYVDNDTDPNTAYPWSEDNPIPAGITNLSASFYTCGIVTPAQTAVFAVHRLVDVWWVDGAWVDLAMAYAGSIERHAPKPTQSINTIANRTNTNAVLCEVSLLRGGQVVQQWAVSGDATTGEETAGLTTTITRDASWLLSTPAGPQSGTSSNVESSPTAGFGLQPFFSAVSFAPSLFGLSAPALRRRAFDLPTEAAIFLNYDAAAGQGAFSEDAISIVRHSNNLIGLRISHYYNGETIVQEWWYEPAITPIGMHGARTVRPFNVAEQVWGSYCPVTHAVAWIEDQAVCWV